MDPDFLKQFTTKANSVKVEEGSRRTVQLPLLHSDVSQVAAQ